MTADAAEVRVGEARPELVRVLPSIEVPLEAWGVMHEDQRALHRVRVVFDALVAGIAAYAKPRRARRLLGRTIGCAR